jgi:Raf kinase inhibitor-like YbhB/YbcL family protein
MSNVLSLRLLAILPAAVLAACSAPTTDNAATPPVAATPAAPAPTPAQKPITAATDDPAKVAFERPQTQATAQLAVTSSALTAQSPIDSRFTNYGQDQSPPLAWTAVPGAQSYAVMLEDPDAAMPHPFVHWIAWNIPADVTTLAANLPKDAQPAQPAGMRQGQNGKHKAGYFGPRPPAGDPPHHYHFEVFALDRMLDLPASADRDALVQAMAGHVVGKGELVATSQAPAGAR